jgi:hypothetical protein
MQFQDDNEPFSKTVEIIESEKETMEWQQSLSVVRLNDDITRRASQTHK